MPKTQRAGRWVPNAIHLCCGTAERTVRLEPPRVALVMCERCRYRQWYVDGVAVDAETAREVIGVTEATVDDDQPSMPRPRGMPSA